MECLLKSACFLKVFNIISMCFLYGLFILCMKSYGINLFSDLFICALCVDLIDFVCSIFHIVHPENMNYWNDRTECFTKAACQS